MHTIPNTHRFFVPPTTLTGATVILDDPELVHQLTRVLRLGPADLIMLLDGLGRTCVVKLQHIERTSVSGTIIEYDTTCSELPFTVTLYVALLRPERFEWVLQKGTELGVSSFVPVVFQRSLPADRADAHKHTRWMRIIREAAEQACRTWLPQLHPPQPFALACQQAAVAAVPIILWEGAAPPLRTALAHYASTPQTIALLSGPEGGISPAELTHASERGMIPVSLGPRILRAETAPIAALAALIYRFE